MYIESSERAMSFKSDRLKHPGLHWFKPQTYKELRRIHKSLNGDTILPEKERKPLYDQAVRQEQFFRKLTGNRAAYMFSTESLGKLPNVFLGVARNAHPETEPFIRLTDEQMNEIERRIDAMDAAPN